MLVVVGLCNVNYLNVNVAQQANIVIISLSGLLHQRGFCCRGVSPVTSHVIQQSGGTAAHLQPRTNNSAGASVPTDRDTESCSQVRSAACSAAVSVTVCSAAVLWSRSPAHRQGPITRFY